MNDGPRLAVVTGANRGIGREIVRQLLARKLRVVATSRNESVDRTAAESLGATYHALDVTSAASIAALAADLKDGLDVLVNNAGISMKGFDATVAQKTLETNFFGALAVTEGLLPFIRPGGRIVMVSSGMGELSCVSRELRAKFEDSSLTVEALVALMHSFVRDVSEGVHAKKGWPSSAYSVSKVGMNAMTRVLARRLAGDPRQILVNAVCPGWVRSDMGGAAAPRSLEQGAKTPVWAATLPEGGPSGGFFRDEQPAAW